MPRKGGDLSQVMVSKFVGNLVRVNTWSETEKPEVIPVIRKCSLSTPRITQLAVKRREAKKATNIHVLPLGFSSVAAF